MSVRSVAILDGHNPQREPYSRSYAVDVHTTVSTADVGMAVGKHRFYVTVNIADRFPAESASASSLKVIRRLCNASGILLARP